MKRRIPKVCGNCGEAFVCGLYGCWCTAITLSDASYEQVAERFHDCLCQACLERIQVGDWDLSPSRSVSPPPDP